MSQAAFFRGAYDRAFQISPILLVNGIADAIPGGVLPFVALVGGLAAFAQSALTSGGLQDFPWRFVPIAGATVISNAVGTYPFANQRVAANAVIEEPTNISLRMINPVQHTAGYLTKLPLFTSMRDTLALHSQIGGSFTVMTPSYPFTNCLLTSLHDVTTNRQQQSEWQFDFVRPLISLSQAQTAKSSLLSRIANGNKQTTPSWSGAGTLISNQITGVF